MDFSVIIPTYNRRELLRRTLQTVLSENQTEPEIIVIDDGSTDGTVEMLAPMAPRVQTLQQANRGPGAARNLGMNQATGKYIAFLDSDDLWFPWTLKTYRTVIEQNNHPAFVTGSPFRFSDEEHLASAKENPIRVESFPDYFASGNEWRWFGASSFIIRRDILTAIGGFKFDINNGEDVDLTLRLGVAPGFVQIKSPVTFGYREHPGTLTGVMDARYRAVNEWIQRERAGQYPGGLQRQAERRRILTRHIRPSTFSLLDADRAGWAWNIYCRTWTWNLAQGRIRYLLGMPAKTLLKRMTRRASGNPATGPA